MKRTAKFFAAGVAIVAVGSLAGFFLACLLTESAPDGIVVILPLCCTAFGAGLTAAFLRPRSGV